MPAKRSLWWVLILLVYCIHFMSEPSTEVVIYGAGIAGIAAAYHLAVKQGLQNVVIIEQSDLSSLTSAKSTASAK